MEDGESYKVLLFRCCGTTVACPSPLLNPFPSPYPLSQYSVVTDAEGLNLFVLARDVEIFKGQ